MGEARRTVVVVDDDAAFAGAVARLVAAAGYAPVAAGDAAGAAAAMDRAGVGLHAVVADFDLGPGPTGADVLARTRALYPWARRVMVSGRDGAAADARAVGATFLLKPPDPAALRAALADGD